MNRELKFNIDVNTNALLCPNPSSYISKSYIGENVADDFKLIPGVKSATKVAFTTFGNVISAANCSFGTPEDILLDAQTVEVCPLEVKMQACQYDLEASFVAASMAQGSMNWEVADFNAWLWEELAKAASEQIQNLRWNGDDSLTGSTYLNLCDGYLVKLAASTGATKVTGATITSANIISALTATVNALPEAVKQNASNVRIYMSAKNALLYQIATLGLNTNFNYTGTLALSFAGFKISVQGGMSDAYIVAGSKDSFGYAFDGTEDYKNLKAVNLDIIAEPIIRIRAPFKVSFDLFNESQIAYYKA